MLDHSDACPPPILQAHAKLQKTKQFNLSLFLKGPCIVVKTREKMINNKPFQPAPFKSALGQGLLVKGINIQDWTISINDQSHKNQIQKAQHDFPIQKNPKSLNNP